MQLLDRLRFKPWVWWPLFFGIQYLALVVVGRLEPAGFDRCEAMPSPGAQAVQVAAAGIAVVVTTGLALWRLRNLQLLPALVAILGSMVVWLWLLQDPQNCHPPL